MQWFKYGTDFLEPTPFYRPDRRDHPYWQFRDRIFYDEQKARDWKSVTGADEVYVPYFEASSDKVPDRKYRHYIYDIWRGDKRTVLEESDGSYAYDADGNKIEGSWTPWEHLGFH